MSSARTLITALAASFVGAAAPPPSYRVVGDAIPKPLTAQAGSPANGQAIVADRRLGLCVLCHAAPVPGANQQGNLAPDLAGVGSRLSPGQLRLRMVDSRHVNRATIMPPYGVPDVGARVGPAWRNRPVMSPQQIEDVVAYLATLKEQP